jgi:hypothetical protein
MDYHSTTDFKKNSGSDFHRKFTPNVNRIPTKFSTRESRRMLRARTVTMGSAKRKFIKIYILYIGI